MYETLAIVAAFAAVYSAVAGGLERTPINGPLVFLAFGVLAGPIGLGLLDLPIDAEGLRVAAELTLALVLFTDAANADLGVLRKSFRTPQRLLLIGLPLTILLGFALGRLLFPELGVLEVAILATMLAPTDAALGKAVVTNDAVPAEVREGLNVESGLNDGICVPILFTFIALSAGIGPGETASSIAEKLVLDQIGIGLLTGVGLALVGGWGLRAAARRDWLAEPWTQIVLVALAMVSFAVAQVSGGSGFIACFAGGLTFGALAKRHKEALLAGAEGAGSAVALITWVAFGAAVVGQHPEAFSGRVLVYALLSLTVARMAPVFLSLLGLGIRWDGKLFIGWFGPRGLASIVFAVIVANTGVSGSATLSAVVVCTVVLSILGHGLTANPLAAAYARRVAAGPGA